MQQTLALTGITRMAHFASLKNVDGVSASKSEQFDQNHSEISPNR